MILQKIRNFFLKLKEEKEQKVLNKILEKCSNSSTAIVGVAGSGKSYFLETLSEYQYKNNYSYMLCGNSIEELIPHFEKHKKSDCVLVFVFNCDSTHSIDVNSFFNNKDVLSILIKEEYLNKFNTKEIKDWFIFFENKENEVFFIVSKNNDFFRDKPYSVIYKNKNYQDKKVCLTDYINNNNKKMYDTLNKELNINLSKEKRKSKI